MYRFLLRHANTARALLQPPALRIKVRERVVRVRKLRMEHLHTAQARFHGLYRVSQILLMPFILAGPLVSH